MDAIEGALLFGGALVAAGNIALELRTGGGIAGALAELRRSRALGVAGLLPYRTLVADGVVRNADGSLLAAFEMEAPSIGSLSDEELEESDTGIANAMGVAFDSRCVVHFHESFESAREYLVPSSYPDPVLAFLDARRADYFRSGATSRSRHIVTVTWWPPNAGEAVMRNIVTQGDEDAGDRAAQVRAFEQRLERIMGAFSLRAHVRRLSVYRYRDRKGNQRAENELLSHLASRFSGYRRRVAHPALGSAVNGLIALPMRGNFDLRVGDLETQVVVVKEFPYQTREAVFAAVKSLGVRYEMGVRFMPLEAADARKVMKDAADDWYLQAQQGRIIDPQAQRKIAEAAEAMGVAGDGTLRFGHTSVFFVVRHRDRQTARRAAQAIASKLTDLMYPAFVTSLTSEDDFFAFLPGEGYRGMRQFPLHTLNITNIFSFHGDATGRAYSGAPQLPHNTVPVAYARNDVGVLRRLHLNNGQSSDTIFGIGPGSQGGGKSFTVGMLGTGWAGRAGDVGLTIVEKGGSSYRFVRFVNGTYIRLLSDDLGLALLDGCEDPDDEDGLFFRALMKDILELRNVVVTPEREEALKSALADVLTYEDKRLRNVTAFVDHLQDPDGAMRPALDKYTETGVLGRTLDAGVGTETLQSSRIMGIELGALLRLDDPAYVIPVLKAVLWKLRRNVRRMREKTKKPWPWLYMIDEAHALLERSQGCEFISNMLKEARKENLGMFLFSQDIGHFADSPIAKEIAREAGTGIWFRNAALRHDAEMRKQYEKMGCPPRGLAEIPYLQPRTFGWSEAGTREFDVLSWEADAVTQAVLGRSRGAFESVGDNARVDEFRRRYPETWREELLRYEGVDESTIAQMREFIERFTEEEEVA